jgi:hypothetical protein
LWFVLINEEVGIEDYLGLIGKPPSH